MRYITIEEAQPGMCLAYDLYDSMGRTMIGRGCELTASYIDKLRDYGFSGVYIDDELSKEIQIESSISEKLRTDGINCIKKSDIDHCAEIAAAIVDEILPRGEVSLDMLDLRSYDDYTYAHSVNVAVLCCVIGMGMQMNERDLNYLVTAALLHDLGKLSIPPEILNKPGRLTPEEYQIMKKHAEYSYKLLSNRWDISAHIKQTVLLHHENYDGSGYPQGLLGKEQSIFVRILHVADVYDALTSKRPYKKPYSPYEAIEYLMGACGIMFDKQVVEVFLEYVPLFPKGTKVNLSDGRTGIIFENAGKHNLRPVIMLDDGEKINLMDKEHLNITIHPPDYLDVVSPEDEEEGRNNMVEGTPHTRIMVVDDMKTNLEVMRSILDNIYDLTLCKSGYQAIQYMKKNPFPDLIIMDVDMPEMTGIEATVKINEITGGTIPVLFVTAICDAQTVITCRELHAAGYIVRPYKPVYIKAEIERILSGWRH